MKKKRTDNDFAKRLMSVVMAIVVLGFLAFLVVRPYLPTTENTITVTGSAEKSVMPDKAVLYLGVESKTETAEQAQQDNTEKINKIISALKTIGVADEDIETTNYYLSKNMRWVDGEYKEEGYIAMHTLKISTTDFTKLGSYIDVSVRNGANNVQNVNFELTKNLEEQKKAEVIADATANARLKAESLADSLGKKLGKIVNVQVSDGNFYYPYIRTMDAKAEGAAMDSIIQEVTSISPQKLQVSTTVSIIYKLR